MSAWRGARVAVHLVEGLATTAFVFPFAQPATRNALVRRWSARLLRMLAIELRISGTADPERGNVLLVANHVSWLDIFVLHARRPSRFVAKSELARWPVVGKLIRDTGTLFIERGRRIDTHRIGALVARSLAAGEAVTVFPEGTTTDGTELLRFHASLLQPAVDANGAVQPVAIRYSTPDGALSLAPEYAGETSFARSFGRTLRVRRLVAEVAVLPPLPARSAHRRELARAAEAAIRMALRLPDAATGPGRSGGQGTGPR